MSRKSLWTFEVKDIQANEILDADFAITDTGELLKKNAKGVWIPVPETGDLAVLMDVVTAKRW